jgi:hypothetical protein
MNLLYLHQEKLHSQRGPNQKSSVHQGRLVLPRPSPLFQNIPGAEVDDAREGSWSQCREEPALLDGQAFPCGGLMRTGHPALCAVHDW